ncbi:DUF3429 domain-containing protein [Sapientia aquatica]|uniref:DUF3429 domain-containing protein n=1 Tax=Sapientia aquatica TaxID=1549640 RepID=A0A4R5VUC5_9BURK|nr:DUF3429 domain-containing protein [Sapientia aquatica]TDK62529.1 DUF3429 domain-containing protein [Sapientia aquatica]
MNHHFLSKRLAHQLGFFGLVPFVFLTLACWIAHPEWLEGFVYAQSAYGIAILSFLGGIHWGVALTSPELTSVQIKRALFWGIVPSVIAWASKVNFGFGFFVLIFGFILSYQVDKRLYVTYQMPDWFLVLRRHLTITVVLALALTVLAVNVRL